MIRLKRVKDNGRGGARTLTREENLITETIAKLYGEEAKKDALPAQ